MLFMGMSNLQIINRVYKIWHCEGRIVKVNMEKMEYVPCYDTLTAIAIVNSCLLGPTERSDTCGWCSSILSFLRSVLWAIFCIFVFYFAIVFYPSYCWLWLSLWYIPTFHIMSNKATAETSVFLNGVFYEVLYYTSTHSHLRSRSIVLRVCFVDRCLSFCTFSFGYCVVCSSSIYLFGLPLCYIQTLLQHEADTRQPISRSVTGYYKNCPVSAI